MDRTKNRSTKKQRYQKIAVPKNRVDKKQGHEKQLCTKNNGTKIGIKKYNMADGGQSWVWPPSGGGGNPVCRV